MHPLVQLVSHAEAVIASGHKEWRVERFAAQIARVRKVEWPVAYVEGQAGNTADAGRRLARHASQVQDDAPRADAGCRVLLTALLDTNREEAALLL